MTPGPAALEIPPLDATMRWLRSSTDPVIQLGLATSADDASATEIGALRTKVSETPVVLEALSAQRSDGSWGSKEIPIQRLLPTLWMAKTLGELGLNSEHRGWSKAIEFLVELGHAEEDVFSIWGTRQGVLSCYVGIAASTYMTGGRDDLAAPHIDWILRYQEVSSRDRDLRGIQLDEWSPHLKEKYGGCMSETTCLVGLLREGRALAEWLNRGPNSEVQSLVDTIREVFLERRVMFRSNGSVVPLAVSPKKAEDWLAPTYPLDWRVDLIEAVDFLGRSGPPDHRIQEAIDYLAGLQLPDGSWPLRRTYRPEHLPKLENRSTTKGSAMITLRVVKALLAVAGTSG